MKKVKIFIYAVFLGSEFWRVKFEDGAISKLVKFWTALTMANREFMINKKGSSVFIDYQYAERFF